MVQQLKQNDKKLELEFIIWHNLFIYQCGKRKIRFRGYWL